MMKNHSTTNSRRAVALCFVLVLLGSWLAINQLVSKRYQSLVSNQGLLDALISGDVNRLEAVGSNLGLEYQVVKNNIVTDSSDGKLPIPLFMQVHTNDNDNVLQPALKTSLQALRPYRLWLHGRYYIMFPVFPTESNNGYLLYAPIIG